FLYISCWGTGEFIQYDVSDPGNPKKTASLHLGGIVRRAAHPKKPQQALNGGPQMVEISRDGKRVYFTNSLYSPWDEQFYPDGVVVDAASRRIPRNQSRNGLALRGGVGDAAPKAERRREIARAHCHRPCLGHRRRGAGCGVSRQADTARGDPLSGGRSLDRP